MAGATLGASAAFATSAQAATTYTVMTNGDGPAAACTGAQCQTLRDAISAANADGGADTITFASGVTGTITLTDGVMTISDVGGLTINGPGAGTLAIDAHTASQIFNITAPAKTPVTISGLTLENGTSSGSGGAIENVASSGPGASSLSLIDSTVSGSTAGDGNGGAIFSRGPLTITRSTITGNTAAFSGGGIDENTNGLTKYDVTITDSTISGNTAQSGSGGGAAGGANFSVSGSRITGNHAIAPPQSTSSGSGGGIYAGLGSVSLTNTTVSGNTATNGGGGIASRTKYGTTITGSTISGNSSAAGGGLQVTQEPPPPIPPTLPENAISVKNSTISGNQATNGAGVEITRGSAYINPSRHLSSPVTIQASTINGNTGGANSFGGGLLITGTVFDPIDMVDSTVSGNTATTGGGVSLGNGGPQPLLGQEGSSKGSIGFDNSTIAANAADTNGGGIYLGQYNTGSGNQSGKASITSTIVSGDTAAGAGQDLFRPTTSTSGGFDTAFSLIQNPGNAPLLTTQSLITGVDPQLGPLANNGGPTQTMLPSFASPVIDQGKAQSGLTTDQRGDPRTVDNGKPRPPGGDATDIGAVELPVPPPKAASVTPIAAIIGPASAITSTKATLNGKINTNGVAVTWHFQWGKTTSYGKVTPNQAITAGHGQVPVSFKITGLSPRTVYHYRLVAVGSSGQTATSSDARFKTPGPTIKDQPGTVVAGKKVRVFGSAGGCPTGDQVTLISDAFSNQHEFAGKPAIHATVKTSGHYSVITTIPATRAPGRYAITGRCGGGNFGVTAHLRVLAVRHVKPAKVKIRFTG